MNAQEIADKLWAHIWENASAEAKREYGRVVAYSSIYGVRPSDADIQRVARMMTETARGEK